jgi:hypothetical protein
MKEDPVIKDLMIENCEARWRQIEKQLSGKNK